MTASTELTATPRTVIGKASRRLSGANEVPAVLYGPGRKASPLSLDRHDFELFMAGHSEGSTIVELKIEGEKKPINAMIREVQHSAVKGNILHVDFMEVSMNKSIHATVAVHLVNDPVGVRGGGVLTINIHEVNVEAKPGDLPEAIEVDVEALEIGQSLLVSDLPPVAGVTYLDDADAVIASVQAPRVEIEEEAVEEAAEPEIIGSKAATEE